ncbi:MAG: cytochrome c3 family protein [Deltaproteobacteria bacterium]|nr:cytochrome c3 family protein [Deltaproteobacteria bacterium]
MTASGCGLAESIDKAVSLERQEPVRDRQETSDYYNAFYKQVLQKATVKGGTDKVIALDGFPKDANGLPNWTVAVVTGLINPRGTLDPDAEEEPMLDLNVFIEAKVPLMAKVLFPHSIHTYWLSCKVCHPKIFIPEAGANDISMEEIFKGQWCGRCHGKVAFTFWPRGNCTRCHSVLKGTSLEKERWR